MYHTVARMHAKVVKKGRQQTIGPAFFHPRGTAIEGRSLDLDRITLFHRVAAFLVMGPVIVIDLECCHIDILKQVIAEPDVGLVTVVTRIADGFKGRRVGIRNDMTTVEIHMVFVLGISLGFDFERGQVGLKTLIFKIGIA